MGGKAFFRTLMLGASPLIEIWDLMVEPPRKASNKSWLKKNPKRVMAVFKRDWQHVMIRKAAWCMSCSSHPPNPPNGGGKAFFRTLMLGASPLIEIWDLMVEPPRKASNKSWLKKNPKRVIIIAATGADCGRNLIKDLVWQDPFGQSDYGQGRVDSRYQLTKDVTDSARPGVACGQRNSFSRERLSAGFFQ